MARDFLINHLPTDLRQSLMNPYRSSWKSLKAKSQITEREAVGRVIIFGDKISLTPLRSVLAAWIGEAILSAPTNALFTEPSNDLCRRSGKERVKDTTNSRAWLFTKISRQVLSLEQGKDYVRRLLSGGWLLKGNVCEIMTIQLLVIETECGNLPQCTRLRLRPSMTHRSVDFEKKIFKRS